MNDHGGVRDTTMTSKGRKKAQHGSRPTAIVTLSVPRALLAALDAFAQAEGRTRSNAAVRLLERALACDVRPAS